MSLQTNPHKNLIADHFNRTFDFEFLDVVSEAIGRIDDYSSEEDIIDGIDSSLTTNYAKWQIVMWYCSPEDANYDRAYEAYSEDIFAIAEKIANSKKEDEAE